MMTISKKKKKKKTERLNHFAIFSKIPRGALRFIISRQKNFQTNQQLLHPCA